MLVLSASLDLVQPLSSLPARNLFDLLVGKLDFPGKRTAHLVFREELEQMHVAHSFPGIRLLLQYFKPKEDIKEKYLYTEISFHFALNSFFCVF